MAYSFEGSLQEFIGVLRQGENVGQILSTSRLDTGGHKLGSLEEKVWRSDAVVLLELFTEYGFPIHKDCYVLAEYDIPGHLGRCDIVILGNDRSGKGHGVIVELKSWSSFESIPGSDFINVAGRTTLHPSSQVQQYVDCTRSFHSRGGDYEWHGMVWMTKMTPQNARRLISNRYAGIPIVSIANAEGLLRQNLADWLSQPIDDASKKAFLDAKPVMRARLAKDLFDRLPNITRGVAEAVEHRPIDLTTRQAEIVHSALHEAEISGRKLVLVSGEPGSGKTVVGLNIMIQQLVRSQANAKGLLADTVVMGLRNNRLCTVLRSAIDDAVGKKVGKALVKYIKPGGPLGGLIHEVPSARDDLRALNPKYKVIVIDEAHRVPRDNQNNPRKTSQLDAVLALGETVVCLVDEGQCLNRDDNGTGS